MDLEKTATSRRRFLGACAAALAAGLIRARPARAAMALLASAGPHPTPRPGITADKVLTREQLADQPNAIPVFDQVREIPEVVDGIRCQCGCADHPGYYSLLSCFEGDAMAKSCPVCQGQGRLARRLHKAGKSLDEIRSAIDARYG
ncbi:MAG TPA: PCYCGC motif-containing (lipo)protein [Gemmatimonadales bacterium]|jgi:hypothetical protein|nr:PCYCGC motif-containing (lipo)protein [Gemmatimonadales bacterium]